MTINAQDITVGMEIPSGKLVPLLANHLLVAESGGYAHSGRSAGTGAAVQSTGLQDPTLATNPHGIADWSASFPFIDMMKMARPWQAPGAPAFDWDALNAGGHLDANGWPQSLPGGYTYVEAIFDMASQVGPYLNGKSFTITWDGTATISVFGSVTNVVTGANIITFDFTGMSLWGITVASIAAAPNHPKNIKIINDDHLALAAAGELFNPDYLLINQDMRLLRFMDWNQTNNSPDVDWADRTTTDRVTFSNFGNNTQVNHVPIEYQVALCNKINADGWFCFPHESVDSVDDYQTQMATYVRDNLNADLVAHFELSNEIWNPSFNHDDFYRAKGNSDWPTTTVNDLELLHNIQGKYAALAAQKVDAVYAGIENRRVNVIGSQVDSVSYISDLIMIAPEWLIQEPGSYVRPSSVCQALAIAPYYGGAMTVDYSTGLPHTANLNAIAAAYGTGTHLDWIYDWLTNAANESSIPDSINSMSVQSVAAVAEGLDLIMYEGMRHYLHGSYATGDALTALIEFTRSQEDAACVLQMWNGWELHGDGPLMQFTDITGAGSDGAWGYIEYYGDTSPYGEMLFALNAHTPNWWGGTGDYSHASITGAVDYQLDSGDAKPLETEARYHVFGHSLFTYDGGDAAPNTAYTRAGEWLGLLAGSTGFRSVGAFTFGFSFVHSTLNFNAPAGIEINGDYPVGNTETYTGGLETLVDYYYTMPSNFLSRDMANQPYDNPVTNFQGDLETIYDGMAITHPTSPQILYVHWPDGGFYGIDSDPSRANFTTYNNDIMGDYLDWHIDVQNAMIAGGRTNFKMFPVGPIIAWLFENEGYLNALDFFDVYGDSAPHGSENIYLLAGMVCYRCLYGTGPDFASFTMPPAAAQIRSEFSSNLVAIDAAIRDRVVFHRANGVLV